MPLGNLTYRRGQIHWVRLDPTVGAEKLGCGSATPNIFQEAEVQKTRSCLIVQNDTMNQYGMLTVVIPFRPGSKKAPYVVNVQATQNNGLDRDRFLDVAQIRAVDGQRILGQIGLLETDYWQQIHTALNIVLGFVG